MQAPWINYLDRRRFFVNMEIDKLISITTLYTASKARAPDTFTLAGQENIIHFNNEKAFAVFKWIIALYKYLIF